MKVTGRMDVDTKLKGLAAHGGDPVRSLPMPSRRLFGEAELAKVTQVFESSWESGVDFGFQGDFETEYVNAFCEFQGGGYADAVSTGTVAIYVALMALGIPAGSDIVVSPVTDPGSVAPVIMLGHTPVIADAQPGTFNIGVQQFENALTSNTACCIITHLGGIPVDIEPIVETAKAHNVLVIEDCSQSHGALYHGKRVGTFGNIAAFSTMFSKNHSTGGCGGLIYTQNEELYWRCRALADRGKSFDNQDFDPKNPDTFVVPSLNFNLDEISCAIGSSTLAKLEDTIQRRLEIIRIIDQGLMRSRVVSPVLVPEDSIRSPFFHTLVVDKNLITVTPYEFAVAVSAEGIPLNPDYRAVVSEWSWMKPFLKEHTVSQNALQFRDSAFNILFNERYSDADALDIVEGVLKVEDVYRIR